MRKKKEINIQVGEQIRIAREQARMTQEQFAEHIDVSPQYISDLERGVVGMSIHTLKRACVALGVPSDQILFGSTSRDRNEAIEKRCNNLTDAEFATLMDMIGKFVTAVEHAHSDK